jgi:hypothetical protein
LREAAKEVLMFRYSVSILALVFTTTSALAHADAPACQPIVIPSSAQLLDSSPDYWSYGLGGDGSTDLGLGGPQPDLLALEIYGNGFAGTFNLGSSDESNYATCAHCILLHRDWPSAVQKIFFQAAGALSYNQAAGPEELDVAVSALRLVEVTIDPNTYVSTPVANGECYVQVIDKIFVNGFDT